MSILEKREIIKTYIDTADERILNILYAIVDTDVYKESELDPELQKQIIERALKSENDIKEGRVYTFDQVKEMTNHSNN
jgi:hypothetical protein